jgi:selenide,water dikinase
MTDITGFGLIGHLKEMLSERFSADLHLDKIPLIEGVKGYFLDGFVPEGSYKNRHESGENAYINDEFFNTLLFDAQTSGGLLISVAENMAEPILQEAKNAGFLQAAIIGEVKQRVEAEIIGR